MSTTFGELKTELSARLRDPDNLTFSDPDVGSLVNIGLNEVGRILPEMFQEDITPVLNTLEYPLRSAAFGGQLVPEIEVARVELWDGDAVPPTRTALIYPASSGYVADSQTGWSNWGGQLFLPHWVYVVFNGQETRYLIRVWGYSPYVPLAADADVAAVSTEAEQAILAAARVEALDWLLSDRNLFTQWQARTGATDISPAGLMNEMNYARDEWRRRSRSLLRLRSSV